MAPGCQPVPATATGTPGAPVNGDTLRLGDRSGCGVGVASLAGALHAANINIIPMISQNCLPVLIASPSALSRFSRTLAYRLRQSCPLNVKPTAQVPSSLIYGAATSDLEGGRYCLGQDSINSIRPVPYRQGSHLRPWQMIDARRVAAPHA